MARFRTSISMYILDSDLTHYQSLVLDDDERILDVVRRFDGTPLSDSQEPLRVEVDKESLGRPPSDFPSLSLSHIPVFSERAVKVLGRMLRDNGQLLTVTTDYEEYHAFNVTSLVDALNVEDSDIVYFPSSGRIMDVRSYVLNIDRLTDAAIFKLTQTPLMNVFVSDEFVDAVKSANLSGFLFKPVTLH